MTVIVATCRECGESYEPDRSVMLAGAWRLCPECRPEPTYCTECGRPLHAGYRTLCARCLGVSTI